MGLFKQKNDLEQKSQKADKEIISSIIDTKMVMRGELLFEGKARIDGAVEGNIRGEHLILSESGKITGDIQVSTFVCHGTFKGNIRATLVTARKSCNINGRIESNSLTVEPGAALAGEMKIASNDLHPVKGDGEQSDSIDQIVESWDTFRDRTCTRDFPVQ